VKHLDRFRKQLLEQMECWQRSQEKALSLTGELAGPGLSSMRASAIAQIEDVRRTRERARAMCIVFPEEKPRRNHDE
jgi:hypothetical protein